MKEQLNDIMKHVLPLGVLPTVKVTGTKKETIVESFDEVGQTIVLKAYSFKVIKEFSGEFALNNLTILNGYLNFPSFITDEAELTINTKEIAGVENPVELIFDDGKNDTKATYRFMAANLANQPKISGKNVKWTLDMSLSKSKIAEFEKMAKIFGTLKPYFSASVEDGKLYFSLGSSSDSNARVFVSDVSGTIKNEPYYPIAQFLGILKLTKNDEVDISFADNGTLKVNIISDYFNYDFYIPGRHNEG